MALFGFSQSALVVAIFAVLESLPVLAGPDNPAVVPFKVDVPNSQVKDLKRRLKDSRIGQTSLQGVTDFSYGVNKPTLIDFKNYWLNQYDWKKQEKLINSLPQYKTEIEGLDIHFIHAKPPTSAGYTHVVPMLIVHGWPGNVFDFHKLIPMLTDPKKHFQNNSINTAFEVIAPSIPGYGWSEQPSKKGFNQMVNARIFNTLMVDRLHFNQYLAQGGDWGFVVVADIARLYPNRLIGLHLTSICHLPYTIIPSTQGGNVTAISTTEELKETGYFHQHATKPDTQGIGLNDSPIGLMAYMLEKFSSWTNYANILKSNGGLTDTFTKDELLTSISIYWFNQNVVSSMRYYKEFFEDMENQNLTAQFVNTPTGYAASPNDIGHCSAVSNATANAYFNICQYSAFPSGGHFAALEDPKQLAGDIIAFMRKLQNNQC